MSPRLSFIPPQLPSLTEHPPEGASWIHEVKHDGYRTMLVIERGSALAYTRNGHDWSDRYSGIIAAARKLSCRSAILDGEVIVQDARGVSDFEALQVALRSQPSRLIFYAFDLLHLDGKDLLDRPLVERRAKLLQLVSRDQDSAIRFSEEFIGDAAAFFRACAAHELEGMVSKLATSRYRSGRSKTWLKTKCFTESELTLLGIDRDRKDWSPSRATRQVRTWAACLCRTSFHCSAWRTARGFRGHGRQTQTGASSVFMVEES
jgi:ATP-dependent DNA ligase